MEQRVVFAAADTHRWGKRATRRPRGGRHEGPSGRLDRRLHRAVGPDVALPARDRVAGGVDTDVRKARVATRRGYLSRGGEAAAGRAIGRLDHAVFAIEGRPDDGGVTGP